MTTDRESRRIANPMTVLISALMTLNISFALMVLFFMRRLRWREKSERAALIGFVVLAVALIGDAAAIWFGFR